MAKRKTLEIRALVETVNRRNRESTCTEDVRRGWNSLLETVLHGAGVYAGFGYLGAADVPEGEKPGIIWHGEPAETTKREFPDETRREYYFDAALLPKPRRARKPVPPTVAEKQAALFDVLSAEEIDAIREALGNRPNRDAAIRDLHNGRVPHGCGDIVAPIRKIRNRLGSNPAIFDVILEKG